MTNGTSKIHYYTKEYDGAVNGMEDPPISPFTSDMSASGDGIVAGTSFDLHPIDISYDQIFFILFSIRVDPTRVLESNPALC